MIEEGAGDQRNKKGEGGGQQIRYQTSIISDKTSKYRKYMVQRSF